MKYGAKMLQWAPFAETDPESADALPKYGTPVNLGALNRVSESPTFSEAKGNGDNALKVYVSEFVEATLAVEVTELSNANAAALTGATIAEDTGKDLQFGAEDNAPYGGLSFYINKALDDGTKVYQGVFYPKVKATMQGEEYTTKGQTITLTNSRLQFKSAPCKAGPWKILSDNLATEAAAAAWVNEKVKKAET